MWPNWPSISRWVLAGGRSVLGVRMIGPIVPQLQGPEHQISEVHQGSAQHMDPLSEVLDLMKPQVYVAGGPAMQGDMAIQFPKHKGNQVLCHARPPVLASRRRRVRAGVAAWTSVPACHRPLARGGSHVGVCARLGIRRRRPGSHRRRAAHRRGPFHPDRRPLRDATPVAASHRPHPSRVG